MPFTSLSSTDQKLRQAPLAELGLARVERLGHAVGEDDIENREEERDELLLRRASDEELVGLLHRPVGRDVNASIQVVASSVSRRHARITIHDGQATVEDLRGKNGTFVGGSRIKGTIVLRDGEALSFGRVEATFRSVSSDTTTRTDSEG